MRKVCASARTRSMIYGSMPSEKLKFSDGICYKSQYSDSLYAIQDAGVLRPLPLFDAPAAPAEFHRPHCARTLCSRLLYRRHSERQSENRNRKAGQTARIRLPETAPSSEKRQLESGTAGVRQMGL